MGDHREDLVYFELNNWFPERDYPDGEPFLTWMGNDNEIPFRKDDWAKENELCVHACFIDMSQNFCIIAKREWVEEHCPDLLTKYTKFIREPDEDGFVEGRFGNSFPKSGEYGVVWLDDDGDYMQDEDDEDDEDEEP